jgi:membrane protein implicated in regulation of membrane protease activity
LIVDRVYNQIHSREWLGVWMMALVTLMGIITVIAITWVTGFLCIPVAVVLAMFAWPWFNRLKGDEK